MANVTFSLCPNDTYIPSETSSTDLCWSFSNTTIAVGNITGNATNATDESDPNAWQVGLGWAIYLILDTTITSTWAVLANLIVITAFFRDPKLRITQNYYIISLATSDLIGASFVLPLGLYSFLYALGWPMRNRGMCKLYLFLDYTCSMQSSLSVCLISYDRCKMVLRPIQYRNEETPRRALTRIASSWLFSILFYGPVTLFWDFWMGYSILQPDECDSEFRNTAWLKILQNVVEFAVPLIIICTCNVLLLLYIRGRRIKMVRLRKEMQVGTEQTSVEPAEDASKTAVSTIEKTLAVSQKSSDKKVKKEEDVKRAAEIKEIKKEQRATRSLMVLVVTFFTFWFWYEIIGNFVMSIWGDTVVPTAVYQASYWPTYHLCAINPLIYAITIERYRYHFLCFFSYVMPCCIHHPSKETARNNRIQPISMANAAIHASSTGAA